MQKTEKKQTEELKGINQPLIILIVVGIAILLVIIAAFTQPQRTIDLDFENLTSFMALIVIFIVFLIVVIKQKQQKQTKNYGKNKRRK